MIQEKEKRIQFKIPRNDKILNNMYAELEEKGRGSRGFVANQIREQLKAFHKLSNIIGEHDPDTLYDKVMEMYYALDKPVLSSNMSQGGRSVNTPPPQMNREVVQPKPTPQKDEYDDFLSETLGNLR